MTPTSIIKEARIKRGVTQKELARHLGWHVSAGQFCSNIERGLANYPLKDIPKICEFLKIPKAKMKKALMDEYKEKVGRFLCG